MRSLGHVRSACKGACACVHHSEHMLYSRSLVVDILTPPEYLPRISNNVKVHEGTSLMSYGWLNSWIRFVIIPLCWLKFDCKDKWTCAGRSLVLHCNMDLLARWQAGKGFLGVGPMNRFVEQICQNVFLICSWVARASLFWRIAWKVEPSIVDLGRRVYWTSVKSCFKPISGDRMDKRLESCGWNILFVVSTVRNSNIMSLKCLP